jgi:hypothetical protein
MARTAVGLFLDRSLVGDLIGELEANGFAREDIRVLGEALGMTEPGAMSIAHTDFAVDLIRELRSMGASEDDAECYLEGLRRGAVVVFAAASDQSAEIAAQIMNRHNAVEIETLKVTEPHLPTDRSFMPPNRDASMQAGRVRSSGSGARLFVW